MESKKVAIVGSGCSGLGALWALKNTNHEVQLFEAASRLGGHTNTVNFEGPSGLTTPVDTGFIVYNTSTYRQLAPIGKTGIVAHSLFSQLYKLLETRRDPHSVDRNDFWCIP